MAQAAPTRERRRLVGWSPPRPSRKLTLVSLGLTLALGSWVFQTYTTTLWLQASQQKEQMRQSMMQARMERDIWLIEYNAGQLRFPRDERVTGRAAFHVFENTRELLALSEASKETNAAKLAEIWTQRDNDIAQAQELFEEALAGLEGRIDDELYLAHVRANVAASYPLVMKWVFEKMSKVCSLTLAPSALTRKRLSHSASSLVITPMSKPFT